MGQCLAAGWFVVLAMNWVSVLTLQSCVELAEMADVTGGFAVKSHSQTWKHCL